jgi:hypothetical protein
MGTFKGLTSLLLRKRRHPRVESILECAGAPRAFSSTRCEAGGLRRELDAKAARRAVPGAAPQQRRRARFSVEFAVLNIRLNSEQKRWSCGFQKAQMGLEPMIRTLCSNVV